jgi:hypothetical protein
MSTSADASGAHEPHLSRLAIVILFAVSVLILAAVGLYLRAA